MTLQIGDVVGLKGGQGVRRRVVERRFENGSTPAVVLEDDHGHREVVPESAIVVMERDGRDYFEAVHGDPSEGLRERQPGASRMHRSNVLADADQLITGERQSEYGDATESFTRLAALWGEVLGVPVTPAKVALCLIQLKVSRLVVSPGHGDSWTDIAGYAALGAEVSL